MMERKNSYAADRVLPFVASFINGSLGFVERCNLTRINLFYTEMINTLLFDHNGVSWTAGELASLQSEISRFKTVVETRFALYCLSGLFTLKFHLVDPFLGIWRDLGACFLRMRRRLSILMCS